MDDAVVPGEGRKRQLPLWMLGVSASHDPDKDNKKVEDKTTSPILLSKPKAGAKRTDGKVPLPDLGPADANHCSLARCKTKRQRRRSTRVDASDTDSKDRKTLVEKNQFIGVGRKSRQSAPENRQQGKRSRRDSTEKIAIPSPGEDEGELTVEDLISIAQEYVGCDKDIEQPLPRREQEAESQLQAVALCENESGDSSSAPQFTRSLSTHEEMVKVHNSTKTSAGEVTVVNPGRTGDPVQDMLNLFFGPLLNKPQHQENKSELMKEDMAFSYQIQKQRQNNTAKEELVPFMKKKSSLKDKVAMFLD